MKAKSQAFREDWPNEDWLNFDSIRLANDSQRNDQVRSPLSFQVCAAALGMRAI
jgi:hypothetical protein